MKSPVAARRRVELRGIPNGWGRRSRRPPTTVDTLDRPAPWPGCSERWLMSGEPTLLRITLSEKSTTFRGHAWRLPSGLILLDEGAVLAPSARPGGRDNAHGVRNARLYRPPAPGARPGKARARPGQDRQRLVYRDRRPLIYPDRRLRRRSALPESQP